MGQTSGPKVLTIKFVTECIYIWTALLLPAAANQKSWATGMQAVMERLLNTCGLLTIDQRAVSRVSLILTAMEYDMKFKSSRGGSHSYI